MKPTDEALMQVYKNASPKGVPRISSNYNTCYGCHGLKSRTAKLCMDCKIKKGEKMGKCEKCLKIVTELNEISLASGILIVCDECSRMLGVSQRGGKTYVVKREDESK